MRECLIIIQGFCIPTLLFCHKQYHHNFPKEGLGNFNHTYCSSLISKCFNSIGCVILLNLFTHMKHIRHQVRVTEFDLCILDLFKIIKGPLHKYYISKAHENLNEFIKLNWFLSDCHCYIYVTWNTMLLQSVMKSCRYKGTSRVFNIFFIYKKGFYVAFKYLLTSLNITTGVLLSIQWAFNQVPTLTLPSLK